MLLTTTDFIDGYRIMTYKGLISWTGIITHKGVLGQAMIEKNSRRDFDELGNIASRMGANAVIGIRSTVANITSGEIQIICYGTEVCI